MADVKQFTQAAIAERLRRNFLRRENIRAALDDSAIASFVDAIAEEWAEGVRFKEYLTRENNWDYARNITSQIGASKMIGYEPRRKRSAITTLTFTVDPNVTRIGGFSDLTYQEDPATGTLVVGPGLVDYDTLRSIRHYPGMGSNATVSIPIGTLVKDKDSDLEYITLEQGIIRYTSGSLETDQEETQNSTSRWTRVSAIQGIRREFIAHGVNGRAFERVTINSNSVEDMRTDITSVFLQVAIRPPGSSEFTPWDFVEDVREAGPYDRVFMVENELDYSRVHIVFGNGFSGRILPKNSDVRVRYLETKGVEGNIDQSQRLTVIRNLNPALIPSGVSVYTTNIFPVLSGAGFDTIQDIKRDAPRHYLTVDTIGSEEAYQSLIEGMPDVQRARVFRGTYLNNQTGVERDTVSFTVILQDGSLPDPFTILRDVRLRLGRKASPTDILQYQAPEYVNVSYNIQGFVNDVTRPLQYFVDEIKRALFEQYRLQNLRFKQPVFHLDVMNTLKTEVPGLQSATAFPEARLALPFYENQFTLGDEGSFRKDFRFNRSLTPFKEIRNDVEYVLRVDFDIQPTELRHRSRTILIIPNPAISQESPNEFIIRQFRLLEDAVLTPARTRAILADTLDTYAEKQLATWHWINRTLLIEDEDYTLDEITEDVVPIPALQTKLDAVPPAVWRILKDADDQVHLYYTEVVNISDAVATEDYVLSYFGRHNTWRSTQWGQDPGVTGAVIEDQYFGTIPTRYAPDETHMAPIEVTFLPAATGSTQAGTGTIFIKPGTAGKDVVFIPPTSYIGWGENGTLKPSDMQIYATPQALDLRLVDDFAIFNFEVPHIKVDLRYRTEFESEFTIAYDSNQLQEELEGE